MFEYLIMVLYIWLVVSMWLSIQRFARCGNPHYSNMGFFNKIGMSVFWPMIVAKHCVKKVRK